MLKRGLLEAVTPEDVREIGKRLVAEAKAGKVAAARVLFMYVLPKDVEPDRLDMDEWRGYQEENKIFAEAMPVLKTPESDFSLSLVREMRPGLTDKNVGAMREMMRAAWGDEACGYSVASHAGPERAADGARSVPATADGARSVPATGEKGPGKRLKR